MFVQRIRAATAGVAVFAGGLLALAPGCQRTGGDDVWPADKPGPKVVASFAPIYCFAANVAGDDAVVRNLMTSHGPHHFDPTDKEVNLLRKADLFLYNGLGLERARPEDMKKGSGNKNLKLVELGAKIPAGKLLAGSCNHDHDHDHDHDHGHDPHFWLSPDYAIILVEGIRDELKAADPGHAADYDRRAAEYAARLRQLKADGLEMLKDKKDRKLVTFHDSMAYFADAFGLNVVGVVQKNPGSEPNPKEFKRLIGLCADDTHPVRVIAVEPQYGTSQAADELRKELARKGVPDPVLVPFDTLETVAPDQLNPGWYEAKMRENLGALAGAMK
jgi:ABC-type Zn uptake system ZnuABC Zn-binding protein ZnuA